MTKYSQVTAQYSFVALLTVNIKYSIFGKTKDTFHTIAQIETMLTCLYMSGTAPTNS